MQIMTSAKILLFLWSNFVGDVSLPGKFEKIVLALLPYSCIVHLSFACSKTVRNSYWKDLHTAPHINYTCITFILTLFQKRIESQNASHELNRS